MKSLKRAGNIFNVFGYTAKTVFVFGIAMMTFGSPTVTTADIVYEFFNNQQQTVTGTFDFDGGFASDNSSWSVSSGTSLSSILSGGLGGIIGDFGNGFVPAVSGDLVATSNFGSNDGTLLDFGVFADNGGGPIVFADGSTISMYTFNTSTPDLVDVGGVGPVPGEFRLVQGVPEPGSALLLGMLTLGIGIRRKRS